MQVIPKAAIVTGGGTGVGRATALRLAKLDYAVLVNYSRSRDEAQQTVADIKALGGRARAVEADVADDAQVRSMVSKAMETFGRLDLLVNNAGTTRFIPAENLDEVGDDDWQRILMVNLVGPFHCAGRRSGRSWNPGVGKSSTFRALPPSAAKEAACPTRPPKPP